MWQWDRACPDGNAVVTFSSMWLNPRITHEIKTNVVGIHLCVVPDRSNIFSCFQFAAEHWFHFHLLVREVHIINSLECRCCPIASRPKVCNACFYTHVFGNAIDSSIYVKCANKQALRIAFLVWRWRFIKHIYDQLSQLKTQNISMLDAYHDARGNFAWNFSLERRGKKNTPRHANDESGFIKISWVKIVETDTPWISIVNVRSQRALIECHACAVTAPYSIYWFWFFIFIESIRMKHEIALAHRAPIGVYPFFFSNFELCTHLSRLNVKNTHNCCTRANR